MLLASLGLVHVPHPSTEHQVSHLLDGHALFCVIMQMGDKQVVGTLADTRFQRTDNVGFMMYTNP